MKGLLFSLILCLALTVVEASSPDNVAEDLGEGAEVYLLFITTQPYEIVDDATADTNTSVVLYNVGFEGTQEPAWYDYNSSVSTGTFPALTSEELANGGIVGANGLLPKNGVVEIRGRLNEPIYIRCENTTGTYIQVTRTKVYD